MIVFIKLELFWALFIIILIFILWHPLLILIRILFCLLLFIFIQIFNLIVLNDHHFSDFCIYSFLHFLNLYLFLFKFLRAFSISTVWHTSIVHWPKINEISHITKQQVNKDKWSNGNPEHKKKHVCKKSLCTVYNIIVRYEIYYNQKHNLHSNKSNHEKYIFHPKY